MISQQQADRVAELLAKGVSQRQAAVRAGVSRGTVATIAAGKWKPRQPSLLAVTPKAARIYRFCRACNCKAVMPCLACDLRKYASQQKRIDDTGKPMSLGLALQSEHRQRYRMIAKGQVDLGTDRADLAVERLCDEVFGRMATDVR